MLGKLIIVARHNVIRKSKNKLYSNDFNGRYILPFNTLYNINKEKDTRKKTGDESELYSPRKPSHFGTWELNGRKKTPTRKKKMYAFLMVFI
nr:hypothetical protein [uncultured Psychroserpens sp.]